MVWITFQVYMFDKFCHIIADPLCNHLGPSGVRGPQFGKLCFRSRKAQRKKRNVFWKSCKAQGNMRNVILKSCKAQCTRIFDVNAGQLAQYDFGIHVKARFHYEREMEHPFLFY